MAEETTSEGRTLEATPTWALATVCFLLIFTSILIEHLLHLLAKYFNKKRRRSLIQALDKIKSDLMLFGFISLLLTVSEKPIANICITKSLAETFLPCGSNDSDAYSQEETKCLEQEKVSFLSRDGVRQLQFLIFILAFFHSLSSVLTFSLGMAKMKRWGSWEAETRTLEYQFTNDPRRFQLTHHTSFGKRHLRCWSEHRFLRWPACFLRQFYKSVSRADYLTLRHGFIMAHLTEASNFDFQKYLKRALEKDFKMRLDLVILSIVHSLQCTRILQLFMASLYSISDATGGGYKATRHYNWDNSFQLAFFTWTWYKFGLRSCFHRETEEIVIRLVLGVVVHLLCGYVTLPLYALVTQMGSSMKEAVFNENVLSVDGDPPSNTDYVAFEINIDEENGVKKPEEHQKRNSFEGFDVRINSTLFEEDKK
ncbi:hypothetical protein JRO89_XS06G0062900 [Xanthoceras sorbifolium]|uniref:MLO-like protein n=1 Tax=Xanthoceras sorbifolium TaxID=99658 RepID=A0ABQ8HX16_9ROSI|nr:hypothetical protein JRO89_XS06G0062900 [Xanthoceras sorbifolium]